MTKYLDIYSDLIKLAAQMAKGEGVPDWSERVFSTGTPSYERRDMLSALRMSDEAGITHALQLRAIADRLSAEMRSSNEPSEPRTDHAENLAKALEHYLKAHDTLSAVQDTDEVSGTNEASDCGLHDTANDAWRAMRTALYEYRKHGRKAAVSLPACECLLRDKAPSAYHAPKCPAYVADLL